jgi:cell fate (sporulation/competence/biofilm development) regulator YlbF (YheA/YmcA/DUF963 family)
MYMDPHASISPELGAAADVLGAALARTKIIVAFKEARGRLDVDEHARALLDRMAEADGDARRKQAEGTLTQADIDHVRDIHREASLDPSIKGFVEAQQAATAYLPEVNELISELLGLDFASVAAAPANC